MRNQTVIRTLIREMLSELDKFSKVKGRDYNIVKDKGLNLEEMAKEEIAPGIPKYYFNMSNDFKKSYGKSKNSESNKINTTPMASINVRAYYDTTPLGYYAYPLNTRYLNKFKESKLPYLQSADWLTIVEATPTRPDAVLYLGDEADKNNYLELKSELQFNEKYGPNKDMDDDDLDITNNNETEFLKKSGISTALSTSLLGKDFINRKIELVYDPGSASIHENEPEQAVFLTSRAFKAVDRYSVKDMIESLGIEKDQRMLKDDERLKFKSLIKKVKTTENPKEFNAMLRHPSSLVQQAALLNPLHPDFEKNESKDKIRASAIRGIDIVANAPESLGDFEDSATGAERQSVKDIFGFLRETESHKAIGDIYYKLIEILQTIEGSTWKERYAVDVLVLCIKNENLPKKVAIDFLNRVKDGTSLPAAFSQSHITSVLSSIMSTDEEVVLKLLDLYDFMNNDQILHGVIVLDKYTIPCKIKAISKLCDSKKPFWSSPGKVEGCIQQITASRYAKSPEFKSMLKSMIKKGSFFNGSKEITELAKQTLAQL